MPNSPNPSILTAHADQLQGHQHQISKKKGRAFPASPSQKN